jgi:hypothetical protein
MRHKPAPVHRLRANSPPAGSVRQRRCELIHILSALDNFVQSAAGTRFEQIFEANNGHETVTELAVFGVVW